MGNLGIYIILIVGLIVRLLFIDKPDGLWNDEYISWMISQKPLFNGFVNSVAAQCHMPFYYLYLKFMTKLFGNSDTLLRLTSVLPGVISIYVMYLIGKLKSEKCGILCAGFCAISSFLIYYSQEVRFYSLLFLFSAISLLYTLKITKTPDYKNIVGYILSNFFILFTHTIGFVYVFFNLLYVSVKLFKNYKKQISLLWGIIGFSGIIFAPLAFKIMAGHSFSQWWSPFTSSKIGFVFTDYFTPMLTNLTASPEKFFYRNDLEFYIFAIMPVLICLSLLIKAVLKKENLYLFIIAFMTFIIMVGASVFGKLVLLTKYSIEIYPILILLVCLGLESIKNKYLKNSIVSIYLILICGYLIVSPVSAFKIRRAEGHKIPAEMLNRANLNENDIILLEYYPQDRFEKYFDFSKYKVTSINKGNFPEYMTKNTDYSVVYNSGKDLYQDVFKSGFNSYLKNKMDTDIIRNLKENQSLIIVCLDSVSFYSDEKIVEIANNNKEYKSEPLLFLVFSHLKNQTVKNAMSQIPITHFEKKGKWSVIKFTKLKI